MKLPTLTRGLPVPRLLPLTIIVMSALLVMKSAALVSAAVPAKWPDVAAIGRPAPRVPLAQFAAADAMPTVAIPGPPAAADAKPGDAKPGDAKPGDAKPGEMKPGDAKSGDAKGADAKTVNAKPADAKIMDARGADARPTDAPPISESERLLLLDLRKRRDELDARASVLATREGVLSAAEARLNTRLTELGALQKRLEALEASRREHDEANWRGLVKLYEDMKPRDAGVIFNDLDMPVLLQVMDRMKDSKASGILAAMSPERARQVTAELAQMRAHANAVPPPPPALPVNAASGKPTSGG